MRLWSLTPRTLDRQALIACWREALGAQRSLSDPSAGYRKHPQLERFYALKDPVQGIADFLWMLKGEADRRGYNFNSSKILRPRGCTRIHVTTGQLLYEADWLQSKMDARSPGRVASSNPGSMFDEVPGDVEGWEKVRGHF